MTDAREVIAGDIVALKQAERMPYMLAEEIADSILQALQQAGFRVTRAETMKDAANEIERLRYALKVEREYVNRHIGQNRPPWLGGEQI